MMGVWFSLLSALRGSFVLIKVAESRDFVHCLEQEVAISQRLVIHYTINRPILVCPLNKGSTKVVCFSECTLWEV